MKSPSRQMIAGTGIFCAVGKIFETLLKKDLRRKKWIESWHYNNETKILGSVKTAFWPRSAFLRVLGKAKTLERRTQQ